MGSLRRELEEKEAQLAKLASELADVLRAVDERRRGLGVVESEVERLTVEGREMREKETVARRETEQLKVSIHTHSSLWLSKVSCMLFDTICAGLTKAVEE